jgi:hypothetical protein
MATPSQSPDGVVMDQYVPAPDDDELVDAATASLILSCSPRTLWNLRTHQGLRYIKVARNVRFRKGDLRLWLHEHTHAGY